MFAYFGLIWLLELILDVVMAHGGGRGRRFGVDNGEEVEFGNQNLEIEEFSKQVTTLI